MADRLSVPARPMNMRDSNNLSESPTELCDDCLQGSKDELEPGYIEDRFRVDRKKLEQMLQGKFSYGRVRDVPGGPQLGRPAHSCIFVLFTKRNLYPGYNNLVYHRTMNPAFYLNLTKVQFIVCFDTSSSSSCSLTVRAESETKRAN